MGHSARKIIQLALVVGLAGCAPTAPFVTSAVETVTPTALKQPPVATQVVAQWSNRVHYEPDPINGGVQRPGIVGRVYLFDGEVKEPLDGDGSFIVSLFDDTNGQSEKPIEIWCFDPEALHKLLRKDIVGNGYTLFLPWSTYKREITNVRMTVRYDAKQGGAPLYSPNAPMTLEHPPAPKSNGALDAAPGAPGKLPFTQP
jgi:hypothetical protein